jgi:hypothetical protein
MNSRYANRVSAPRGALVIVTIAAALASAGCGSNTSSNPGQVAASASASVAISTAPSISAATLKLNGTYRWTLTKQDALAHGAPVDKTAAGLAGYPSTVMMQLDQDKCVISSIDAGGGTYIDDGFYRVDGDTIVLNWPREAGVDTLRFTADPKGNLHMTYVGPEVVPGGVFVLTLKTWTKVG